MEMPHLFGFVREKGNLEEQSKEKMESITPNRDTRNLLYSLLSGFEPGSTTFINWELVTKKRK